MRLSNELIEPVLFQISKPSVSSFGDYQALFKIVKVSQRDDSIERSLASKYQDEK